MSATARSDRIRQFIMRQYVTCEGAVRANVEELFSPDLVYHAGDKVLSREDMVTMGDAVRAGKPSGRRIEPTGFAEEGARVRWHLSAWLPGFGPDGTDASQETEVTAVFGDDDLVSEMWSVDSAPPRD